MATKKSTAQAPAKATRPTIASLKAELEQARNDHEKDIKTLAEALKQAAEEHDLCDVFYKEIDKVNKKLTKQVVVPPLTHNGTIVMSLDITADAIPCTREDTGWHTTYTMTEEVEIELNEAVKDAIKKTLTANGSTKVYVSVEDCYIDY